LPRLTWTVILERLMGQFKMFSTQWINPVWVDIQSGIVEAIVRYLYIWKFWRKSWKSRGWGGGWLMNIPHTFESYQMIRATYGQKMMEFGLIEVLWLWIIEFF
jgi:hypothetical protein